ncbi:MAG: peptide chain release factor 2 [Lentisphaeria bacterium]
MTLEDIKQYTREAEERLEKTSGGIFDVPARVEKRQELEQRMTDPSFWDDKENAQATVGELSRVKNIIDPFTALETEIGDFSALAELIEDEGEDPDMRAEADDAWRRIRQKLERLEMVSFLSDRQDPNNAFLAVHAGAGGTESCDWAEMLWRMYSHWAERNGYATEVVDYQPGDEAGIKSATMHVTGEFSYGYLKNERGVHRLVRISPFDSNKRRHTSFAAVDVVAEIEDDIDVEIDEGDLRIDTYRSSGAGGQHVNKTDSAVRITHNPTGIMVSCQNERSQHKNKATAMKLLRARLYEREVEKQRQEKAAVDQQKSENAWGSQIRSYVLHPYQMVKDLRTEVETSNPEAVLNGEIDQFIEAMLKKR